MAFSIKDKKILVWDVGGLFLEHSLQLAHDGAQVKYYTPWATAFPTLEAYAPGYGYEDEGLEKVFYFWPYVDWADMIFMPDVGTGTEAEFIREHFNKPVFGSALKDDGGNKLEQERWWMRQLQKKIGLPTQDSERIIGVPKLREYLKSHNDKYIKLDKFRGDIESFQAKSYDAIKLRLDEIEASLGPFQDVYQFVAESFIEGIEPGFDCIFNGKDWVKPYLWGIEQSKEAYLGKFVDELPEPLQLIADKLKPVLADMDYRGAISIEARITKDGTPYLIDVCSRFPAPLSAVYTMAMENYSEVIYKTAAGEDVTIKPKGQYVGVLPLRTEHAKNHYVKLDFPQDYSKYIKTRVSAKIKGDYYGVKGMEEVFVLCVAGNNWQKLIPALKTLAKKVDTFNLNLDPISGLHRIEEVIQEYEKYNMGKF